MSPRIKRQNPSSLLKTDKSVEPDWNKENVILTLKYIQHKRECFSDWDRNEMSKFWNFNRRLHQMTWQMVYETASKGKDKRGMAYTVIPRSNYSGINFFEELSEDIKIFELRVDDSIRVHGFREKGFFHLCLLDR